MPAAQPYMTTCTFCCPQCSELQQPAKLVGFFFHAPCTCARPHAKKQKSRRAMEIAGPSLCHEMHARTALRLAEHWRGPGSLRGTILAYAPPAGARLCAPPGRALTACGCAGVAWPACTPAHAHRAPSASAAGPSSAPRSLQPRGASGELLLQGSLFD